MTRCYHHSTATRLNADGEEYELDVVVAFEWESGSRATTNDWDGGDPGEPAGAEILDVLDLNGKRVETSEAEDCRFAIEIGLEHE